MIFKKTIQRDSNFEMLRIFCMMMVILIHYIQKRPQESIESITNASLLNIYYLELHSVAIICVHCFILISGYFRIKWSLKSFADFIFQIIFWLLIGYIIARYLINPIFPIGLEYDLNEYISSMLNWLQARWFVSAYLTLYILSPLINSFINKVNEDELAKYIIVFYIFSTLYGYLIKSKEFDEGLSAISLIGLYLVGAWLRVSTIKIVHWNKWYDLLAFFLCTIFLTVASFLLLVTGIQKSIYGYLNPIVIIESIFLFQFFRKCNIGKLFWINYFAAGAFSAFLMHCHPYLAPYCYLLWNIIESDFSYSSLYIFLSIIIIFIIAVMIDKIRAFLYQSMTKWLHPSKIKILSLFNHIRCVL